MDNNLPSKNFDAKKVGKILKKLRNESGLTQEQVGAIINREFNSISQMENGRQGITLPNMADFCKIFGVTPNSFFEPELIAELTANDDNLFVEFAKGINLSKEQAIEYIKLMQLINIKHVDKYMTIIQAVNAAFDL